MKHLTRLNPFFWKYRGRFALGILFIILSNIFNVYAPVLIGEGIDFLTESLTVRDAVLSGQAVRVPAPESFAMAARWLGLEFTTIELSRENFLLMVTRTGAWLAIGYILFYVLKGIFLFFQRQTIIVMSRYIEYDLKNDIYDQYQRLDASFYRRHRTGDLMNRISEDVSRVRMYLGPAVMYTINLIVLVVMCITVMWQIDPILTLYTLSPLPFMGIAIFYVSSIINRRTERSQREQSALSAMVQESVSGIRMVRAYGREEHFIREFRLSSGTYKARQLELVKADALFMPVIAILVGLSTILTIYVGSQEVMAGHIGYGTIVQFVFYVNQLTWPFASVGWVTSLVQKASASQQRINEFLDTQPAVSSAPHATPFRTGPITFHDVSFTYPESGVEALRAVSFEIPEGSTLGIVGRTGSGKSTIASLLLRLYDPTTGIVGIHGTPLHQMRLDELRQSIAYVPQDVFLFSDTIGGNLAFGKPGSTAQDFEHAARTADLHDTVMRFPEGYETRLGERGINLSGGQKQRVAIARAVIRQAPVLILDDCLSAVDTDTEERILSSLAAYRKNRTTLVIAHRLSAVRHADRILVMEHGAIVESGSHAELIARNGIYAGMWTRQQALSEPGKEDQSQASA
ncbi:MAG: ABC transporter ATP-binding protein [Flavobacteriales bacterium]